MSISTHIVGLRPPDDKWNKMKSVYEACKHAGIEIPDDVIDFFDGEKPDKSGVTVDLEEEPCVSEYHTESASGYEVDVTNLPKDVKVIRFYNCW